MFQSAVIHADFEFTNHNAVIKAVCYNRHQDCFVSADDTCLRLWSPTAVGNEEANGGGACAGGGERRQIHLPVRTTNFIQALEHIESRQLYVAAALDGTLKVYDLNMAELASVFTGRGTILSMVFDATHNRLLTGGVDGCATDNGVNPHYELSPLPSFFHHAAAGTKPRDDQHDLDTDIASSMPACAAAKRNGTRSRASAKTSEPHERPWVQSVQLNPEKTKLYAQSKHCVDVFSATDDHFIETYADLFPKEHGAIMAFVVHEKTQYVVCGCINGWIFVVSLHPSSVLHVFKEHTLSITSLAVHTSSNLILSSSLDGIVRLWDLEARRQAHRLDIGQPVQSVQLLVPSANPCRLLCRVRSRIQLFCIQSTIKEHLPVLSPVCVLQRVLYPTHREDATRKTRNTIEVRKRYDDDGEDVSCEDSDESEDNEASEPQQTQVIVAAEMDKTIRLFAGRTANEAPSFTWIPEETSLDLIAFALNPCGKHLFLLLESQRIIIADVENNQARDKNKAGAANSDRVVDMSVPPSASSSWSGVHGSIRCIYVCYYPPIFRSAVPSAAATASVTPAAQSKWFSRTFVTRRQPSSIALELKKTEEEFTQKSSINYQQHPHRRNALIQPEYEWIVCGSEFGHLLFWHTGLANNGKEAISIDTHDAAIISVATSTSSPLLVTLGEAKRVNFWHLQPVFTLRHMLDLSEKPSCFVLSPISELLLSGYDDGNVLLMDVSDPSAVETYSSDENHFAMVSAADFLDEKGIVLTASVDAMIKIWDQQKTLLRQIHIAMAFAGLCFMNASGDVMAGLSKGIFIVTKDDVLPEKVPKQPRKRKNKEAMTTAVSAASRSQKEDRVRPGVLAETHTHSGVSSDEDTKTTATTERIEIRSNSRRPLAEDKLLCPAQTRGQPTASSSSLTPNGGTEEASTAKVWQKPSRDDLAKWIKYVDRSAAVQHVPVLRPVTNSRKMLPATSADQVTDLRSTCQPKTPMRRQVPQMQLRRSLHSHHTRNSKFALLVLCFCLFIWSETERIVPADATCRIDRRQRDRLARTAYVSSRLKSRQPIVRLRKRQTDERLCCCQAIDAVSTLGRCFGAAGHQYSRRKAQVPPSPVVLQTLTQNPHANRDRTQQQQQVNESAATGSSNSPTNPTGSESHDLRIGSHNDKSSLQYCKHQAPVPPKEKTPRELWNAIGGGDRRLIVLQRNNVPQLF